MQNNKNTTHPSNNNAKNYQKSAPNQGTKNYLRPQKAMTTQGSTIKNPSETRPDLILINATKKYPGIIKNISLTRHEQRQNSDLMSDNCFLPLNGWQQIVKIYEKQPNANLPINVISTIFTWQTTQSIYKFKQVLFNQLTNTHTPVNLDARFFLDLPEYCAYIHTPDNFFNNKQVYGFFVAISYDSLRKQHHLSLSFDTYNGFLCTLDIPVLEEKSIKTCIEQINLDDYSWLTTIGIRTKTQLLTSLLPYINIVLYVCCQNSQFSSIHTQGKPSRHKILYYTNHDGITNIKYPFKTTTWQLGSSLADFGASGFAEFKVVEKKSTSIPGSKNFCLYWNGV